MFDDGDRKGRLLTRVLTTMIYLAAIYFPILSKDGLVDWDFLSVRQ